MRVLLASLVLLFGASAGFAQDMPLFAFAKLGAKWDATEFRFNTGTVPTAGLVEKATCTVVTKDGATMFVGYSDRAAVWAYPVQKDGKPDLAAGGPYAPLRIVEGYDNSREAKEKRKTAPATLAVTALMIDPAGRVYTGTSKDIQVFDPTGRLCGTLPLPKAGTVRNIGLATDSFALLADIDGTVWNRPLK